MPTHWQHHYRPPVVPAEIEAKARELVVRAAERRTDLWAHVTKEKFEAIVLAVASDLQTPEGAALSEELLPDSEPGH